MPISPCYLFKSHFRHVDAQEIGSLPDRARGLYVLFDKQDEHMNVVYVGMARGDAVGVKGRLRSHRRNERKKNEWTHFSFFEVWDNISKQQVEELEGLFRMIYATDEHANRINIQKSYGPLSKIVVTAASKKRRAKSDT